MKYIRIIWNGVVVHTGYYPSKTKAWAAYAGRYPGESHYRTHYRVTQEDIC